MIYGNEIFKLIKCPNCLILCYKCSNGIVRNILIEDFVDIVCDICQSFFATDQILLLVNQINKRFQVTFHWITSNDMNWLYHCCICNITFHLKISWLKLPRSSLCDNHCTIFFTIWSEFIVQKISTYHIAVSIHNFTCDIYDFIKDTYSTLDFIWNRVKKVHFSRSSRTFGEDSRSDKIYSSGNRGVKKGPGPRGSRDEEFLMPSLFEIPKQIFLKSFFGIKNQPNLSDFFSVKYI